MHRLPEVTLDELVQSEVLVEPAVTRSYEDLAENSSKSCSASSLGAGACATGTQDTLAATSFFARASATTSSVPEPIPSLLHPPLSAEVAAALRAARSAKGSAVSTNSSRPSSEIPVSAPISQQAPELSTVAPESDGGSTFELQGNASKGSEFSERSIPAEVTAADVDAVRVALPPVGWIHSEMGANTSAPESQDVSSAPCALSPEIESTTQYSAVCPSSNTMAESTMQRIPVCPSSDVAAEEALCVPEVGIAWGGQDHATPPPEQAVAAPPSIGSARVLTSWEQQKLESARAPRNRSNVLAGRGPLEEAALVAVRAQLLSGLLAAASSSLDITLPADVRRGTLDNWGDRQASHHRQARAWVVSQVLASPGKTTARDSAHLRSLARDIDTHILAASALGSAPVAGSRPSAHALPAASDRLELVGAYVDLLKKNVFEDLAAQPAAVEIAFGCSPAAGMDMTRPAELACVTISRLADAIMKRLSGPADRPRPVGRSISLSPSRAGSPEPPRLSVRPAMKPRTVVTPRVLPAGRGRGLGTSPRNSRQPGV